MKSSNLNYFFFISLLFITIFTNKFHYDEASIYYQILNINDPSILEALNDKELTFGKFFFVFFSKFNKINDIFSSYFYLRLPSFFSICLIFYFGGKILKNFFKCSEGDIISFYLLTFLWFGFFSGGVTSRYDSILTLSFFFTFYAYVNLYSLKKDNLIYISFLFSTILIALHPYFFFSTVINFFIIMLLFFNKASSFKKKTVILIIIIVSIVLLAKLIILDKLTIFNIEKFLMNTKDYFNFANNYAYRSNFSISGVITNIKRDLFEFERFRHLRNFNLINFFLLISTLIILFIRVLNFKNFKDVEKINYFFIILIIFILLVIPNKWAHHLSILVPFLFLSLVYFLKNFFFKIVKLKFYFNFIFFLFILFKLVYDLRTNYFFYQFLEKKIEINSNKIFRSLITEKAAIQKINEQFAYLTFYSNPELNFIFTNLVPSGQHFDLAIKKKKVDLIFIEKRFNPTCNFDHYNYLKFHIIKEFSFQNNIWIICGIKL